MDLGSLNRIHQIGGVTFKEYQRLVDAADASQAGSPAAQAKAQFEQAWQSEPITVVALAEEEAALVGGSNDG